MVAYKTDITVDYGFWWIEWFTISVSWLSDWLRTRRCTTGVTDEMYRCVTIRYANSFRRLLKGEEKLKQKLCALSSSWYLTNYPTSASSNYCLWQLIINRVCWMVWKYEVSPLEPRHSPFKNWLYITIQATFSLNFNFWPLFVWFSETLPRGWVISR